MERMSVLTALSALLLLSSQAAGLPRPKRGFVGDGGLNNTVGVLANASWFYAYNPVDPFQPAGGPPHPQFVPMYWCFSNETVPPLTNLSHFMGYNEPNDIHSCNKSPRDVAIAWATVMQNFPTSRLVSPATAGFGILFFDAFFANCTELYGPTGCNISVLAVHDYDCNPQSTLDYLTFLSTRYKLPIWLTEFSCGDGKEDAPMSAQLSFMQLILPLLDAAPFVERYAWMSAHSANRSLVTAGPDGNAMLTPVGELYNTL
jgi:hypothetical protein